MIGVLILAHAGVANPEIWIDWAESDPQHPIRLFALCEGRRRDTHDAVCFTYNLSITMLPTTWCGPSIAVNTIRALREAIRLDPHIKIIYLVSGHCLPVQRPEYLWRTSIILPRDHVDAGKRWYPSRSTVNITASDKKRQWFRGVQWISVTRDVIRDVLVEDPDLYRQLQTTSDQCLDETYLHTLIWRSGVRVQDVCFTDMSHTSHKDPSPITWNLDDERRRTLWSEDGRDVYETMTGRSALAFAHRAGYVFCRKFHPSPTPHLHSYEALEKWFLQDMANV